MLIEKLQGFSNYQIEVSVDFLFQNEFKKTYDGIKGVFVTIENSYIFQLSTLKSAQNWDLLRFNMLSFWQKPTKKFIRTEVKQTTHEAKIIKKKTLVNNHKILNTGCAHWFKPHLSQKEFMFFLIDFNFFGMIWQYYIHL